MTDAAAAPETRQHKRSGTYAAGTGRSYCYIWCPYCQAQCRAYIWSLAGGGKRCPQCRALHTSLGVSIRGQR